MDRPDPVDARLTELEIKASLAEDTVDHLNEVVIAQQARIDALVHEVARLARPARRDPAALLSAARGGHHDDVADPRVGEGAAQHRPYPVLVAGDQHAQAGRLAGG
ncbi:MAG: SlyX family protein [Burkholderiales bacterium]